MPTVRHDALADFGARLLVAVGLRTEDAHLVASLLVKSDLHGYPAHGIAHLPGYLDRIKDGLIDVSAVPEVVRDGPTYALVDGRFAFGQVVAHKAMTLAMEKARTSGIAIVGAIHSGHMGRLAHTVPCESGITGGRASCNGYRNRPDR